MNKQEALENLKEKVAAFLDCLEEDQRELGADYLKMMVSNIYDEHEEFMAIVAGLDN